MMWRILCAASLLAGACAGSRGAGPHDLSQAQARQWASPAECERLVEHLEEITFLSQQVTRFPVKEPAFRAHSLDPREHQARVDQCTITVTKADYGCLMAARDTRTAAQCQERFQ